MLTVEFGQHLHRQGVSEGNEHNVSRVVVVQLLFELIPHLVSKHLRTLNDLLLNLLDPVIMCLSLLLLQLEVWKLVIDSILNPRSELIQLFFIVLLQLLKLIVLKFTLAQVEGLGNVVLLDHRGSTLYSGDTPDGLKVLCCYFLEVFLLDFHGHVLYHYAEIRSTFSSIVRLDLLLSLLVAHVHEVEAPDNRKSDS